jgi:hypothetical protein
MAPSVFFTLHTEADDVSDAAPYGKGVAAHCFVGGRTTVEGCYPPDWPQEFRYFKWCTLNPATMTHRETTTLSLTQHRGDHEHLIR